MFEDKSIWQIIHMGGFTMYILVACSIVSLAIILERFYQFHGKAVDIGDFMDRIRSELTRDEAERAAAICQGDPTPASRVVAAGLRKRGQSPTEITHAMEREILSESVRLEHFITILGTLGNVAVYIGLFGTVLGIVRAFHNISVEGSGGLTVVIGGVAEALVCTATGLLVAVPSVVAYNYFIRRIDTFVADMECCASETSDLLTGNGGHGNGEK